MWTDWYRIILLVIFLVISRSVDVWLTHALLPKHANKKYLLKLTYFQWTDFNEVWIPSAYSGIGRICVQTNRFTRSDISSSEHTQLVSWASSDWDCFRSIGCPVYILLIVIVCGLEIFLSAISFKYSNLPSVINFYKDIAVNQPDSQRFHSFWWMKPNRICNLRTSVRLWSKKTPEVKDVNKYGGNTCANHITFSDLERVYYQSCSQCFISLRSRAFDFNFFFT